MDCQEYASGRLAKSLNMPDLNGPPASKCTLSTCYGFSATRDANPARYTALPALMKLPLHLGKNQTIHHLTCSDSGRKAMEEVGTQRVLQVTPELVLTPPRSLKRSCRLRTPPPPTRPTGLPRCH